MSALKGNRVLQSDPPIIRACERNQVEEVEKILSEDEDAINTLSIKRKDTPLHIAVNNNYIDLMRVLLQAKKLNGWIEDSFGMVPLDYAYNSYRHLVPELEAVLNPKYYNELDQRCQVFTFPSPENS